MTEKADYYLDISEEVCPITFVKTKLFLERVEVGTRLAVRLKGSEPLHNVPLSVQEMGHRVLSCTPEKTDKDSEIFVLVIEKCSPA